MKIFEGELEAGREMGTPAKNHKEGAASGWGWSRVLERGQFDWGAPVAHFCVWKVWRLGAEKENARHREGGHIFQEDCLGARLDTN